MDNPTFPIALAALKKAKVANERIDALPLPMVFKGTLGTGGTISTLPTASSSNEGFVYIVITDGTYAGQSAKAGDTFVSDGSAWVLIPSADDSGSLVISQTLTAGQTSITFNHSSITADSAFLYWTSIKEGAFGISPTNAVATTGSLTLTFPAQSSDMIVKVEVV
jgi:hypothetical protein